MGFVAVRKHRIDRQVIGKYRVVGRERRGDHFINSNARPRQAPVEAADKPGGIRDVRAVEQRALLHRTANFAAARQFSDVSEPAPELLFESKTLVRAGTASCKEKQTRNGHRKEE